MVIHGFGAARKAKPEHGLRRRFALLLFPLSTLAAAPSAFAANADITVLVTPVPAEVSVSRTSLANYAAFEITITNTTKNTINQVVLNGATDVVGETPDQKATFVESIPSGICVPAGNDVTVQCNVGQLRGSTSFVVIFASPPLAEGITYLPEPGSRIEFTYSGQFSNGNSPITPTAIGGVFGPATKQTSLITTQTATIRTKLKTFIPSFGGSFFTGDNATAVTEDPSTTKLKVPPGLGLKTANVDEEVVTGGQTNDTLTTNTTTITIPSSTLFALPVTVELRRDSSTIRVFNKIDRVPVYYTSDALEPVYLDHVPVPSCADASIYPTPPGPSAANPVCILNRIAISKRTVLDPPVTDADVGDWLFVLRVLQNGRLFW